MNAPTARERADQQVQRLADEHRRRLRNPPPAWEHHPNRLAFRLPFITPQPLSGLSTQRPDLAEQGGGHG